MKVTFDKQKLLSALAPISGISQTKNTLVSVGGILFECPPNPKYGNYDLDNPNLCRLSAFDLEKGMRTTIECNVFEEGLAVIESSKIIQIVRALPDGDVTLEIDDKGHVMISAGYSNFEIMATSGENFPTMPNFTGDKRYKIPQYKMKNLINETVFCVAQNDQRAAFNGGFLKIKDSIMYMIGSDGNRISGAACDITGCGLTNPEVSIHDKNYDPNKVYDPNGVADAQLIIPYKFLTELSKLLSDSEDEMTVIISRKNIVFKIDDIYFFTRMIDTDYIDYDRILPRSYMTELFVSRKELLGAVERASIVTEDKLGGTTRAHVKLVIENGAINLTSVSAGGSIKEKVVCSMTGADITIGFNCRYLLEALRAAPPECDTLRVRLNQPLMGIMLEPAGGTNFVTSKPDPEVYGERALDADTPAVPADRDFDEFMYFVLPIRMNG